MPKKTKAINISTEHNDKLEKIRYYHRGNFNLSKEVEELIDRIYSSIKLKK